MLDVARLWRDIGFEPKRTVVLAAFDARGGHHFVNSPSLPTSFGDTWTVVTLDGLAAGGERLARQEEGFGLAKVLDDSARRMGLRTEELDEWEFFFINYDSGWARGRRHEAYSGVAIFRPGDELSGGPDDTLDHLDPALLAEAGQMVAHYLMVLANR
jgi:hypothetical protein